MPWQYKFPDLKNDPSYLEPRVTAVEQKASDNASSLADIPKQVDGVNETIAKLAGNENVKIVCAGDSLTYGVVSNSNPIQQVSVPYPQHLQSWLTQLTINTNVSVINSGNPGYRVDQFYPSQMSTQVYANNPDCVIFMFGANEAIQNSSKETFRTNYDSMVKEVTGKGIEVVILGTHDITSGNAPQWIDSYNRIAQKIAEKYNCVFVDWNGEFKNYLGNRKIDKSVAMPDGIHFINDQYYKLIADVLIAKAFCPNVFDIGKHNEFYLVIGNNVQINLPSVEIDQTYKYGYNVSNGGYVNFSVYNNTDKQFYFLANASATGGAITIYSNGINIGTVNLNYPKTVKDVEIPLALSNGLNYIELNSNNISTSGDIIISAVGADYNAFSLLTPKNSWATSGSLETPIACMKGNLVHFSGYITAANGGIKTDGTVLFTLPAAFAPKGIIRANVNSEGGVCQLEIETNGDVKLYSFNTQVVANWLYLGGVNYIVNTL